MNHRNLWQSLFVAGAVCLAACSESGGQPAVRDAGGDTSPTPGTAGADGAATGLGGTGPDGGAAGGVVTG
ncbi:MAG TPA: hypothetical protein VHO67_02295, partial [Polyangia bacterium]|nr:hypothetical protein [Polyangia bacterium]